MERAAAGRGPGPRRGDAAIDADRQADQCRFPERCFDPADQHHDAGANKRPGGPVSTYGHRCADTSAAAGYGSSAECGRTACASSCQKAAAGAETRAGRAGPAVTGAWGAGGADGVIHSCGACERMIVFKVAAAR